MAAHFHLRILIVEDSISSALLLEAQITRREPDFSVKLRSSLRGAKVEIRQFQPHVLILDLNLDDSSGDETLASIQELKGLSMRKMCVLVTTSDPTINREICIEAGADDFMPKVFGEDAETLMSRILTMAPKCADPS